MFSDAYNKKTNEIYEVLKENNCYSSQDSKPYGLNNDLHGLGHVWLREYSPKIDRFIYLLHLGRASDYYDFDCIAEKNVKYPQIRDQLIEYANDPEGSPQKIMILMKAK